MSSRYVSDLRYEEAQGWSWPGARTTEILRSLPHEDGNEFVFIGVKKGVSLSNEAMAEFLKGLHAERRKKGSIRQWSTNALRRSGARRLRRHGGCTVASSASSSG
jgi:hypothetical protein